MAGINQDKPGHDGPTPYRAAVVTSFVTR
jgi:hypothetical protein